jgi:3',5'-cyclic AMP phosphodiesterase CpdA
MSLPGGQERDMAVKTVLAAGSATVTVTPEQWRHALAPYLPRPPSPALAWSNTLDWWRGHHLGIVIAGGIALFVLMLAVLGVVYFFWHYRPGDGYRVTRALAGARVARFGVFLFVGMIAIGVGTFAASLLDNGIEQSLVWLRLQLAPGLARNGVDIVRALWTSQGGWLTFLLALVAVGIFLLMPVYEAYRVAALSLALAYAFGRGVFDEGKAAPARPPLPRTPGSQPDVLLISDLHVAADAQLTIEGGLPDTRLFPLVEAAVAELSPRAIIVAGDVTDTGAPSAWHKAAELFARLGRPVFVAPGNHDYHFAALNRQAPTRGEVLLGMFSVDDGTLGSSAPVEAVSKILDGISPGGRRVGRGKKRQAFPVLHENLASGLAVLILDSNGWETTSPVSNAVGQVGAAQLAAARKLLKRRDRKLTLLVVLHHHVLPARNLLFLACVDAHEVISLGLEHGAAAIIHGHKHMPYVREYRDGDRAISIVSCGSALYDAKGPCADAVGGPSCLGLHLEGGRVREVSFVTAESLTVTRAGRAAG